MRRKELALPTDQGPGALEDDIDGFFLILHLLAQTVHVAQQANAALHKDVLALSVDLLALRCDAIG